MTQLGRFKNQEVHIKILITLKKIHILAVLEQAVVFRNVSCSIHCIFHIFPVMTVCSTRFSSALHFMFTITVLLSVSK